MVRDGQRRWPSLDERCPTVVGFTLILLLSAPSAFAYIDPGSGALVWQLIVSAIFGGLFVARKALWRVLKMLGIRKRRPDTSSSADPQG